MNSNLPHGISTSSDALLRQYPAQAIAERYTTLVQKSLLRIQETESNIRRLEDEIAFFRDFIKTYEHDRNAKVHNPPTQNSLTPTYLTNPTITPPKTPSHPSHVIPNKTIKRPLELLSSPGTPARIAKRKRVGSFCHDFLPSDSLNG